MISAAMFVRNENRYIVPALTSLTGLVDEIRIVDTGSTDGTIESIERVAARGDVPIHLVHESWHDDFAWHRNHVQEMCEGEWIVVIDGDERIKRHGDLREKILTTEHDAVYVQLHCETDSGRTEKHPAIRAYRKAKGYWTYPIHNQLEGVETADKSTAIVWSNYAGTLIDKTKRSIPLLVRYHEAHPYDAHPTFFLAKTYRSLGDWENTTKWSERTRELMGHDPRYALVYVWLIEAAIMRDEFAIAARYCDEGLHRHPGFGQLYHSRITLDCKRWLEGVAQPGPYLWQSQPSADFLRNLPEASRLLGLELQYGLTEDGRA